MTQITSNKSTPLTGTARIPGDKSMSHRALMLGALTEEETIISGLLESDDVLCTATALRKLGASVHCEGDGLWRIHGRKGCFREPDTALDMGNSGTSVRLFMGLVAGYPVTVSFTGDASLSKRPMKRVTEPLEQMGAVFPAHHNFCLPLTIQGTDALKPLSYSLPVASAQVKTAILLAGLRADGITTVMEKHPTRDHTENMLRHFGVEVTVSTLDDGTLAVSVEGGQELMGCAVDIPGDPSSAAFLAVAAILTEGAEIRLPYIGVNKRRTGLYVTLKEMGADITFANERIESGEAIADLVVKGTGPLNGIEIPPDRVPSMIDEFPVLAMAAACAKGTTTMTGLAELRVKESDRLQLVAEGLAACGVKLEEGEDHLTIHGNGKPPKGGALINTALDHRIAMSFLVLGCATKRPVRIDDDAPIKTSFPDFIELMNGLGSDMTGSDDVVAA